jgi:hypothetical protein
VCFRKKKIYKVVEGEADHIRTVPNQVVRLAKQGRQARKATKDHLIVPN